MIDEVVREIADYGLPGHEGQIRDEPLADADRAALVGTVGRQRLAGFLHAGSKLTTCRSRTSNARKPKNCTCNGVSAHCDSIISRDFSIERAANRTAELYDEPWHRRQGRSTLESPNRHDWARRRAQAPDGPGR